MQDVKLHDDINFENSALIYSDYIIQHWNGHLFSPAQQESN